LNADLAGARAPLADSPSAPAAVAPIVVRGVARGTLRPSAGRSAWPPTLVTALVLALSSVSGVASAQQSEDSGSREMTVEELERHIAEQKAALERVRENRDITVEKAAEVREALAEREAKRAEAQAEVESLCREREEIEPGSFDECVEQLGG